MSELSVGEVLRQRRQSAGLTQRELAKRSGVPQPNIAAYESGRRRPATKTLTQLERSLSVPTLDRLRSVRSEILLAATKRRLSDVRVFGSVARGQADADSDVDLLVKPSGGATLFDLAGFAVEIEGLLGLKVDVVSDRGKGPAMEGILAGAVPL